MDGWRLGCVGCKNVKGVLRGSWVALGCDVRAECDRHMKGWTRQGRHVEQGKAVTFKSTLMERMKARQVEIREWDRRECKATVFYPFFCPHKGKKTSKSNSFPQPPLPYTYSRKSIHIYQRNSVI